MNTVNEKEPFKKDDDGIVANSYRQTWRKAVQKLEVIWL